jgi:E3 ubiquitin-protein ligase TRIP12
MSQRVTRSSAARLAADSSPNDPPTHNPTDTPPTAPTLTRKRKAASTEQSPATHKDHRKSKRSKPDDDEELEAPEPAEAPKKRKRKSTAAAMSSAGYGNSRNKGEDMTDPSRPSSSTSGESSPQNLAKDSSKRKSRKSGKDGESGTKSASKLPSTDRSTDPVASASGTSSRKSKRGSRKDHDTLMKDVDEKAGGEPKEHEEDDEQQQDTQEGADVATDARRRQMEEDMEALDRAGGDPFGSSGFLSRFGGPGGPGGLAGLGGLTSQLRAMTQMLSGTGSRLRGLLEQLKAKDDTSTQLIALTELSDLLLVSNEDNLAGHFAPDQFVKELVTLMQPNDFTGEENPEIMLLACRCIANLMEALPAATASVVYGGAVPVLCQKLLEIHFIDLAEQALTTLEKISVEFPSSIVREGGLTACLTYLDFFATSTQRTAVTTAANCCRNIPEESFPTVRDVMPILLNTLSRSKNT